MKPRRTFAAAVGVAAALGLVLVFAVIVLVFRATRAETADVEPSKQNPAPELGAGANPRSIQPEGPPPAVRVHVRIKASPSNAQLVIDGKPMSDNPFVADQPADEADHELRVEAKGYDTETRILKFNQNADIEIALKKSNGTARVQTGKRPDAEDKLPDPKIKKKPPSTALDPEDPWK